MTDETFEEEVMNFLRRNFPQIQMHGGDASVLTADEDTGTVEVALGGACSGCGISPMTIQAIKSRMQKELEPVTTVTVSTNSDLTELDADTPDFSHTDEDDGGTDSNIKAPF